MSAFDPTSIGAVAVADEFDPASLGAVPVDAPAAVSAPAPEPVAAPQDDRIPVEHVHAMMQAAGQWAQHAATKQDSDASYQAMLDSELATRRNEEEAPATPFVEPPAADVEKMAAAKFGDLVVQEYMNRRNAIVNEANQQLGEAARLEVNPRGTVVARIATPDDDRDAPEQELTEDERDLINRTTDRVQAINKKLVAVGALHQPTLDWLDKTGLITGMSPDATNFARRVKDNALGTIGGAAGLSAAAALAPETGGASILLALLGAYTGAQAGSQTQEQLSRLVESPQETTDRHLRAALGAEESPMASKAADLAGAALLFRPDLRTLKDATSALAYLKNGLPLPAAEAGALQNTLGAFGIGAGQHVAISALTGEPLTLEDTLKAGGEMAFFSKPTAFGESLGLPSHPPPSQMASRLEAAGLPKAAAALREATAARPIETASARPAAGDRIAEIDARLAELEAEHGPRMVFQGDRLVQNPDVNRPREEDNLIAERDRLQAEAPAVAPPPEAPGVPPEPNAEEAAPTPPETTPEPPATETNPPAEGTAETTAQPGGGPTAIKNAQTAIERAARGLPAATEPGPRTWEQARAEAAETIARDPEAPGRLVAELKATPRALNDTEDALLLHRQVQLQNEYDRLTTLANQAIDAGDEGAVSELGERRNELLGHLQAIYDVDESVGTVASRGFNARKMAMASDFTLTKMLADKRADQGADLTPPEIARVEDLHRQIADLQAQVAAHESGKVDAESHAAMDEALAKMVDRVQAERTGEEQAPAAETAPKLSKRAEKKSRVAQALDALSQKAAEARARLRERAAAAARGESLLSVLDPRDLDDYAVIGADMIAKGAQRVMSLWRFTAKMVVEFGEHIREHAQAIYDRARDLHAQTVSPRDLNGERERIVLAVKERVEEGDSIADLGRLARGLAENYVRRGVTEREALVDAVHAELAPAMPGLTRRQTMDAISGYGDRKLLSKEAALVRLREIKGELREQAKLNDMANGLAPKASGVEQHQKGDEERRLGKLVHEAKKKGGFTVTDPATQLRSAVGAIETRLANELKDLTEEFALGKKEGETRVPPTSDRIETLRGMIARVKESLRAVRESKGRSEEEQLAAATKATQRSLGEYERRLREDDFAPKEKGKAATSPELDALRAKRDAVKQEYLELRELDEGVAQRKEEARTRQLRDNIAELDRKLREGDTAPEAKPGPMLTSEQEALVSERDAMLRQLEEARRGPKKSEAEAQVERLLKSVNELDRRLREGDLDPKAKGAVTPLSPEAEHLMAIREAMQRELRAQQAAARPKKSDAELALQRWKTNALRQEADLRDRIARGDFAPKAKNPVKLDAEAQATKARLNQLTLDWRREREKARLAARPWPQRMLDAIAKWRRAFVLSGPVTLAKLTSSAFEIGTFTPGEDLVGGALGKLPVLSRVAAEAPRHGAFHWRAQAEAVGQTFTRLFSDVGHSIKTGHMDLDLLYGKPDIAPRELKDYIGAVHGALKAPARRNEFTRSFRMRIDWKASKGVDVTDPMIQLQTANEAYLDANRAIFSEDNLAVRAYRRLLSTLGEPDPITGQTPILAKAFQTGFKYVFPVVRIPTNIVARTFEYSLGTVSGGLRMTVAAMKGFDKLRPDEADLIMRNLKRGSVGLAVLLVGFFNPENVGGYYQAGRKREEDDVKTGGARIGGVNVPRYLIHNPLLEQLQIGATIRRVADSKLRKKDREEQGVSAGVLAAMLGLVEEVPFAREIKETAKAFTPRDRGEFVGRLASGVVPEGLRFTAEQMDKDAAGEVVKRKPESAADYVLQGIPVARERVRTKEEADKAAKRRR